MTTTVTHPATPGDEQDRLLTPREAAELLGCHPNSLARWADAGQITAVRRRVRRLYPEAEIRRLGRYRGYLPADPEPVADPPTVPIRRVPLIPPDMPSGVDRALAVLLSRATGVC